MISGPLAHQRSGRHATRAVFRTVVGTKLNAATSNMVVAFEVYRDATHPYGRSVLVRDVAREITDSAELDGARALPLRARVFDPPIGS